MIDEENSSQSTQETASPTNQGIDILLEKESSRKVGVELGSPLQTLDIQLKMLMKEYDLLKEEIREFSKKSQSARSWAISLWAGSIAFAISPTQGNAEWAIFFSAVFPTIFWIQDTFWTQMQRMFIFRSKSITDFFTSDRLDKSISEGKIVDFRLDGLRKNTDKELFHDNEYKDFASFWRVLFFRTNLSFYPPLLLISLVTHILFNLESLLSTYHKLFSSISMPP